MCMCVGGWRGVGSGLVLAIPPALTVGAVGDRFPLTVRAVGDR